MIQHVKTQNWIAIGIDFLIVVLGVFIGIQVSNWNDKRFSDVRRDAAIVRLHYEAERIVVYFRDRVSASEDANDARRDVLRRLDQNDWGDADSERLREGVTSTYYIPLAAPPRGIYDEMLANGLFGEIDDPVVRESITEYYSTLKVLEGQIDYVRKNRDDYRYWPRSGVSFDFDDAKFGGLSINFDFDTLSDDEDFVDRILIGNSLQYSIMYLMKDTLKKAEVMCQQTARVSGGECAPVAVPE